jgi:hypothetical protein
MNFFIHFLIFLVVLFIYMHIMEQYKTSDKMQLYEMDYIDNAGIQSACNVKQPFVFELRPVFSEFFYRQQPKLYLEQMGMLDVHLKDTDDYWRVGGAGGGSVDSIVLSYRSFHSLISSDTRAHYISEGNTDFVGEADLGSLYQRLDGFLKPPIYTCQTEYDILMGSQKAVFPLRYHTHDRIFLCILSGKLSVKMTPWKSRSGFAGGTAAIVRDYENYEFWVRENPWGGVGSVGGPGGGVGGGLQTAYLDFMVLAGQTLFVPAYWFYSIRFEDADTVVAQVKYNSPVNMLANVRDIGRWYLQQKNIVRVSDTPSSGGPTGILEITAEESSGSENDGISEPASDSASSIQTSLEIITRKG